MKITNRKMQKQPSHGFGEKKSQFQSLSLHRDYFFFRSESIFLYFYNFNSRGSSTPYSEHGLCRQTESHNGGTIAPQRSTERAAIFSATNGTTRGECFQQLFQAARAWQARQADIGGLRKQLEEEWRAEFEEQKRKHDLEIKRVEERLE